MRYALVTSTPPGADPLAIEDAREHVKVLDSLEDANIQKYERAARDWYEDAACRALINTVFTLHLDSFPGQGSDLRDTRGWDGEVDRFAIYLPRNPVVSVASIKYDDTDGVEQTLASTEYRVAAAGEPRRITPAYGKTWPTAREQTGAVRVVFTAGYGTAATDVPERVKQVIRLLLSHSFEHHEPVLVGTIAEALPQSIAQLFWNTRVHMPEFARAA